MTKEQKEWLEAHPDFEPVGEPRKVRFREWGTLYADGRYEVSAPMKPIRLEEGCFGVGAPVAHDPD